MVQVTRSRRRGTRCARSDCQPIPSWPIIAICGVQQVEVWVRICRPCSRPVIVTSHQEKVPPMQVKGFGFVTSGGCAATAAHARAELPRSPPGGAQVRWKAARPMDGLTARSLRSVGRLADPLPQPATERATRTPTSRRGITMTIRRLSVLVSPPADDRDERVFEGDGLRLGEAARKDRERRPATRPLQPHPAGEGGDLLQEGSRLRPDAEAGQAPGKRALAGGRQGGAERTAPASGGGGAQQSDDPVRADAVRVGEPGAVVRDDLYAVSSCPVTDRSRTLLDRARRAELRR